MVIVAGFEKVAVPHGVGSGVTPGVGVGVAGGVGLTPGVGVGVIGGGVTVGKGEGVALQELGPTVKTVVGAPVLK